ncbi:hypothetical protein H6S82_01020 [Planktothrix sp. FACHB-1355]|uniref:Uncharacterized protein n=1 Tax=Aerosakkonema funiforme FACHB-1375 TaxID=2949571 RepID=A0A926VJ40_9CYAN|nr:MULTISPECIES: hypothetical protein [Oscillatoriales]MBD2184802.1 hypothetical protein [Aerosakkonema funiforme FACHB-1375]MBD3557450.1 hypothetical protein [Planktothrix sp. FACHB-1355]
MYFPPKRLADTTNICGANIKGTREDLSALIEQFESKGFQIKSSDFYFNKLFDAEESDWNVEVNFFLQNEGDERAELSASTSKTKSVCFSIIEGLREDLSMLVEQLEVKGFSIEKSEFYPSYSQLDNRMIWRIYVRFM